MLKKLFNVPVLLLNQQSKCLMHLNSRLLADESKKKNAAGFEDFEKPSKFLNIKALQQVGILKDGWDWPKYNRTVYPPQAKDEPRRNAYVHHMRTFIKASPTKLWYPAIMIRGMTIDEAIKQLSFQKRQCAEIVKEVLLEAQELAVKEHNVEFKSNLWVAFSDVERAQIVKGVRKHMGPRMGIVKYKFSHYHVRLEEGKPIEYKRNNYESFETRAKAYIEYLRSRRIVNRV